MGLGKTVMTIALILAKPNGESSDDQDTVMECNKVSDEEIERVAKTKTPSNVKGGTLIVCPMALLGQWKVSFLIINACNSFYVLFNNLSVVIWSVALIVETSITCSTYFPMENIQPYHVTCIVIILKWFSWTFRKIVKLDWYWNFLWSCLLWNIHGPLIKKTCRMNWKPIQSQGHFLSLYTMGVTKPMIPKWFQNIMRSWQHMES